MTTSFLERVEYRYGCAAFDQLHFGLSQEQRSALEHQTGYCGQRLELATRIIEDNGIPHWFVFSGASEDGPEGGRCDA